MTSFQYNTESRQSEPTQYTALLGVEKRNPLQVSPSFAADSLGALREFKNTVTGPQFSSMQLSDCSGVHAQGCHC